MNSSRTLSLLSAAGLLVAASAQTLAAQDTPPQAPPAQTQPGTSPNPDTASSPHQREATGKGAEEATAPVNPDPRASTPHQEETVGSRAGATERAAGKDKEMSGDTKPKDKLVGLTVESSDGKPLGSVVDIVRDRDGMPTYAVIAIDNDTTAVPYETASSMVRGGKVVMNSQRLAAAPKVKQTEWLDQTSSKWRTETDRYWGTTRTASPGEKDDSTKR